VKRIVYLIGLLALMILAGCGNKDLILTIDLLSYVDQADLSIDYGPVPAGIPTTSVELLQTEANLLQGIGDATEVKSATLTVGADFANNTGSATGNLQIFVASIDDENPYTGQPVADFPVTLQPSHTTVIDEEIAVSPEQLDALTSEEAWFAIRIAYNTQGSNESLQGTVTLTKLTAVLVTESDL